MPDLALRSFDLRAYRQPMKIALARLASYLASTFGAEEVSREPPRPQFRTGWSPSRASITCSINTIRSATCEAK